MKRYNLSIKYSLVKEDAPELKYNRALSNAKDVANYIKDAFEEHPLQESVWVILLNSKNTPMGRFLVSLGTVNASIARASDIFRPAIVAGARSIILSHNHPSGDPMPSMADHNITRTIKEAGKLMDIPLMDHVICGTSSADPLGQGYYSFKDAGFIE
jgi:DNA repair protein RadC